ncbi:unnamed protein product [Fraxinus pennsylvanica]|uniref:Response regulatory domain-containing protein n=1 Tax=Fraxinus pennsylvanica TaxID=56036 RepID=A0AAD2E3S3_9LAMI|nr:unnamed protein product [Fraxinus pennsylvanica]
MSEGSVLMNIDSNKERESLNEDEAIQNKVLHGGQILLKDNVLKIETNNNNGNDVTTFGLQGQGVLQAQQQLKPRGTVVCWEQLLHVRSIQVMLVENDDSTRHVVSALLRNCNYEVVEAANGLQAWKLLEDLTNHIDLVLTEVVMPCVSGIVLLSKIKSHKTRKNIPVINNKTKKPGFVAPRESKSSAVETAKENEKRIRAVRRVHAVSTDEASPSGLELDYNVAAAT